MITVPTYEGKMGQPLLFSNGMRCLRRAAPTHLQNIPEETLALRQIIREFYPGIHQVKFATPAVLLNIKMPEAYQEQMHNLG
ncbi:MAG: hypothetical protein V7K21_15095 [Nostoc sp.]|uniref:hypothetical protein n=1 Tax=Nostoc sp. TaxID=1180 RepID=UPI002FF4BF82